MPGCPACVMRVLDDALASGLGLMQSCREMRADNRAPLPDASRALPARLPGPRRRGSNLSNAWWRSGEPRREAEGVICATSRVDVISNTDRMDGITPHPLGVFQPSDFTFVA